MGSLFCCFTKLNSEVLMLISTLYIVLQTLLWVFCIYTTLFVSIPYISDKNESQEFICSLIISFLSICFFRNFYLSITTKCYITKEDSEKNKQIYLKENSENSKTNSNEKSNLLENKIKNEEKTIFYCKKCRFYRGDRAHHCSVCNVCVEKMDHHCHVIKNCVGFKNYKFFLSYLFGVTSTAFSILIFSLMSCYKSIKGFKVKYY